MMNVRDVLARIPGWQDSEVCRLSGGLTNDAYKIDSDGRLAVLKFDQAARLPPFRDRSVEAAVQCVAADAGLAAPVIAYDADFILTEFIDGEVWTAQTLQFDESLERLGRTLRRLHALPCIGRSLDAEGAVAHYIQAAIGMERADLELCAAIVQRTPISGDAVFSHNDLVAENLIATPELKFLDWEYAGDNHPMFDLATIIEHHQLSEASTALLWRAYSNSASRTQPGALHEQRLRYLALLCLWLASREETQSAALQQAFVRLTTRHSEAL